MMPHTPSVLPASAARTVAPTATKALPKASKDSTNAFAAVIEEEMRKSAGAAASANLDTPVSTAGTATPASKPSRRSKDEEESDARDTSSSANTDQASQGQLLYAAVPIAGLSSTIAAATARSASTSAQFTPSAAANVSSEREASRIDVSGANGATVVRVQTQFAPSDLFSSQIAAGSSAGASVQSVEAATLAPAQAQIISGALSSAPRSGESVASKTSLPGSLTASSQSGSESEQADVQSDAATASDIGAGKALNTGDRVVSGGSAGGAASKQNRDTSDGSTQAPSTAPLASAVNPGVASGAGDLSAAPAAQQIFDGIQSSLPSAASTQTQNDVQQTTPNGPLKTITIALNPANLGTVAVELSLKNGQLGVKLQVENPATAQMLRHDDGALETLLQSAGYSVQSLQVSLQSATPAGAAAQTGQSGQNFSNQTDASSSGQQQQSSQHYDGQPPERRQDQRPGYGSVQDLDGGGSLYV